MEQSNCLNEVRTEPLFPQRLRNIICETMKEDRQAREGNVKPTRLAARGKGELPLDLKEYEIKAKEKIRREAISHKVSQPS